MSETPHAETTQAFTQLLVDRLGNAHRILVDRYSLGSKVSAEIADSDDEIASTLRDAAMHLRAALRQPRLGTWDVSFAAEVIAAFLAMGVCPHGYDRDDLRAFVDRLQSTAPQTETP